ncbi:hypothetical protein [Agromyces silvae]|nr:hypothetical protein [Agromyces protaetiae]
MHVPSPTAGGPTIAQIESAVMSALERFEAAKTEAAKTEATTAAAGHRD